MRATGKHDEQCGYTCVDTFHDADISRSFHHAAALLLCAGFDDAAIFVSAGILPIRIRNKASGALFAALSSTKAGP